MISFNLRLLYKNAILLAWPGLILFFVLAVLFFGNVEAINSTSFTIHFGERIPISSSTLANQVISVVGLIALIALPTHLVENLKSERASLLFSKPISRTDFFLSDVTAVFLLSLIYSLFTTVVMGLFIGFSVAIIPLNFLFSLLFIPLLLMAYYAAISLLVMLTGSYMASVFVAFFLPPLSMMLFLSSDLLPHAGITSGIILQVAEILNYVVPSIGAAQKIAANFLDAGNSFSSLASAFDFSLMLNFIVSCIPSFLLSYYLLLKKEF